MRIAHLFFVLMKGDEKLIQLVSKLCTIIHNRTLPWFPQIIFANSSFPFSWLGIYCVLKSVFIIVV